MVERTQLRRRQRFNPTKPHFRVSYRRNTSHRSKKVGVGAISEAVVLSLLHDFMLEAYGRVTFISLNGTRRSRCKALTVIRKTTLEPLNSFECFDLSRRRVVGY